MLDPRSTELTCPADAPSRADPRLFLDSLDPADAAESRRTSPSARLVGSPCPRRALPTLVVGEGPGLVQGAHFGCHPLRPPNRSAARHQPASNSLSTAPRTRSVSTLLRSSA